MNLDELEKQYGEELYRLGITDPDDRRAVLQFLYQLVQIAVDIYIENGSNSH